MRNDTVSVLKAIGIILMVIGHSTCPMWLHDAIYSFHMPLFLMMSGYCLSDKYLTDRGDKTFIIKRLKSLYIPFVKWNIVFILLHNFLLDTKFVSDFFGVGSYSNHEIADRIAYTITYMVDLELLVSPIWFLKELLLASVITLYALRLFRRKWIVFAILFLIVCLFVKLHVIIPYIDVGARTFLCATFFCAGYLFRKVESKLKKLNKSVVILSGLVLLLLSSLFYKMGVALDYYNMKTMVPYSICAILGCISLYFITARMLPCINYRFHAYLVYLGDNTLPILVGHFSVFAIISKLLLLGGVVSDAATHNAIVLTENKSLWALYSICGVIIPILINYCYQKISKLFI